MMIVIDQVHPHAEVLRQPAKREQQFGLAAAGVAAGFQLEGFQILVAHTPQPAAIFATVIGATTVELSQYPVRPGIVCGPGPY